FQTVLVAELLERQILTREFEFLGKLHKLAAVFFEGVAQQVAQVFDSTFGHGRSELGQSGECVQSVDQKVRIQAGADRIQTCGRRQRFCTCRQGFLFVQAVSRLYRVRHAREDRVKPESDK